ncbi:DUF4192 domain-containing protein [Micromonospora sp. WMMD1102]|uniref:DUF4192 domain-containing protein n=1 Tax=Micromonospora sp. WMMD1102 TaxID=3016105 RepID=UPI002414E430|nr:DUF4192 domain-containing protein [Micromonospora sp. WMMD1102]MDG4790858.1 DUF4192 domain-containing protein [Micromonospora sp. WMMD1102]
MTSNDRAILAVRSTADLLAAVPYLLGFHPADSLVVMALRGNRVVFVARGDLPEITGPAAADEIGEAAAQVAAIVARQHVEITTVIGYGEPARVTPTVDAVTAALGRAGLPVLEALRVTGDRYWSYVCDDAGCCPPDGRPFDCSTSQLAAAATFAGQVALPDRDALARRLAPLDGPARDELRKAAGRAEIRLQALLAEDRPDPPHGRRALRRAGRAAVREATDRYRNGGQLTDDEVAWLCLLMVHLPVRDDAWQATGGEEWHLTLWTDVLRRAEPELVPAPATLLGFAAWRAGQGALASVAVERALAAQPDYSFAQLLAEALQAGIGPSVLDGWPDLDSDPCPET